MLRLVALATFFALTGCRDSADNGAASGPATSRGASAARAAPATQPTEFTGTLRGGVVAIGGESTGWRLDGDGQTGGIDLDVSKVRQRAGGLEGRRVSVTGTMTTRSWAERGETPLLVADKIEPAPPPGK